MSEFNHEKKSLAASMGIDADAMGRKMASVYMAYNVSPQRKLSVLAEMLRMELDEKELVFLAVAGAQGMIKDLTNMGVFGPDEINLN